MITVASFSARLASEFQALMGFVYKTFRAAIFEIIAACGAIFNGLLLRRTRSHGISQTLTISKVRCVGVFDRGALGVA